MLRRARHYAERNPFTCASVMTLAVLGLALASKGEAYQSPQQPIGALPEFAVGHAPAPLAQPLQQARLPLGPRPVDLSYLNRKSLGFPLNAYVGVHGTLPEVAEIDFGQNLDYLWRRKLAVPRVSPATRKSSNSVVARYKAAYPDTKGIREFVAGISAQSVATTAGMDWVGLCAAMKVEQPQCGALRVVSSRLGGRELAAYGMTELFAGFDGRFNYVLLDTLLRNAGENYLAAIPALGDTRMSLGFYQFTSDAVYAADKLEGANSVDRFNDKRQISGSVATLVGPQHHRAAKMFAVYNLIRLLQKTSPRDAATLSSGACSTEQLTQFVATAHHMPTRAIRSARRWISAGCRKPLKAYLIPHLQEYAAKTSANYAALEKAI